jgi:hypothetical protein
LHLHNHLLKIHFYYFRHHRRCTAISIITASPPPPISTPSTPTTAVIIVCHQFRYTYDATHIMPAVLCGNSRLQFEISKNGGEIWDAVGQVRFLCCAAPFLFVTIRVVSVHELHDKYVGQCQFSQFSQLRLADSGRTYWMWSLCIY